MLEALAGANKKLPSERGVRPADNTRLLLAADNHCLSIFKRERNKTALAGRVLKHLHYCTRPWDNIKTRTEEREGAREGVGKGAGGEVCFIKTGGERAKEKRDEWRNLACGRGQRGRGESSPQDNGEGPQRNRSDKEENLLRSSPSATQNLINSFHLIFSAVNGCKLFQKLSFLMAAKAKAIPVTKTAVLL